MTQPQTDDEIINNIIKKVRYKDIYGNLNRSFFDFFGKSTVRETRVLFKEAIQEERQRFKNIIQAIQCKGFEAVDDRTVSFIWGRIREKLLEELNGK